MKRKFRGMLYTAVTTARGDKATRIAAVREWATRELDRTPNRTLAVIREEAKRIRAIRRG